MRNLFIIFLILGCLGYSLTAIAGQADKGKGAKTAQEKKPGQETGNEPDSLLTEANKKLGAAQRKKKQKVEREALKAETRKLRFL